MEKVEAAVGEADLEALPLPLGDLVARLGRGHHVGGGSDAECLLELGRAHRRRARLEDDDAGRGVGEPHRIGQREAGGKGRRQRRDDRVAGAGNVEDAMCLGRDVEGLAAAPKQRHPVLAAGDEDRVDRDPVEDAPACGLGVGVGVDAHPGEVRHLVGVRA